jgi:DHA1 family bicyclomycin/chloramphenicol resistance-like MFS transporter
MCAVVAVVVAAAVVRLPETLPVLGRAAPTGGNVWVSCRTVLTTPGIPAFLLSLTALFGVFLSYLASSEIILDQVFGLEDWFPAFFGGIALAMGLAMWINGRVVVRVGLDRMLAIGFGANLAAATALAVTALASGGRPPFWLFVVLLGAVLFFQQMLIPNLNAAAMRPLAHVAGTGAAILGMVAGAVGAVIGGIIDRLFDGTVTPLAIGFVVSSTVAVTAWRRAVTVAPSAPVPAASAVG